MTMDDIKQEEYVSTTMADLCTTHENNTKPDKDQPTEEDLRPYRCKICNKGFHSDRGLKRHEANPDHGQYNCEVCGKQYFYKIDLQVHFTAHGGENPFQCEICRRTFSCSWYLKRHIRIHSREETFQCVLCQHKFPSSSLLKSHKLKHYAFLLRKHKCEICGKEFTRKNNITRHMKSHSGQINKHKCDLCGKQFTRRSSVKDHLRTHDTARFSTHKPPVKDFDNLDNQCTVCLKTFSKSKYLKKHMSRTHNVSELFQCPHCVKCFKFKPSLSEHIQNKHSQSYQCKLCDKRYEKRRDFSQHIICEHPSEKQYKCAVCKKEFKRIDALRKHKFLYKCFEQLHEWKVYQRKMNLCNIIEKKMKIRSGTQFQECGICEKRFLYVSGLKRHQFVHRRLYHCDICDKPCHTTDALKRHIFEHKGHTLFQCEECGKSFLSNLDFNQHILVHTASRNKQYQCDQCPKICSKPGHLETHKLVHSGVKAHKCHTCGKYFQTPSTLRQHSVIHTGVKQHQCHHCGERYGRASQLRRHIDKHHPDPNASKPSPTSRPKNFECETYGRKFSHVKSHNAVGTQLEASASNPNNALYHTRGGVSVGRSEYQERYAKFANSSS